MSGNSKVNDTKAQETVAEEVIQQVTQDPGIAAAVAKRLTDASLQVKRVVAVSVMQVMSADNLQYTDLDLRINVPMGTCKTWVDALFAGEDADITILAALTVAINRNLNLTFQAAQPKA